ncbi:MAG: peptide chain release factor N(5)-glutamine methyltransferase [Candidatus Omnitrophota bacterium]
MKLKEWITQNKNVFIEGDLRFLLKHVLSNRIAVYDGQEITENQLCFLENIKNQYAQGLPLGYLLGKEEFFGLELNVGPGALLPRKETELIVERAIACIAQHGLRRVLDVGCGSGNISLAIKKRFNQDVKVFSADISPEALGLAKANFTNHKLPSHFIQTDIFAGFLPRTFDLIISNPPYVANDEIEGSLCHEPRIALEASDKGFSFIEKIVTTGAEYLKGRGYLILEIGYNHKERLERLLAKLYSYEIIEWIKDYDGNWRGIVIKLTH